MAKKALKKAIKKVVKKASPVKAAAKAVGKEQLVPGTKPSPLRKVKKK